MQRDVCGVYNPERFGGKLNSSSFALLCLSWWWWWWGRAEKISLAAAHCLVFEREAPLQSHTRLLSHLSHVSSPGRQIQDLPSLYHSNIPGWHGEGQMGAASALPGHAMVSRLAFGQQEAVGLGGSCCRALTEGRPELLGGPPPRPMCAGTCRTALVGLLVVPPLRWAELGIEAAWKPWRKFSLKQP